MLCSFNCILQHVGIGYIYVCTVWQFYGMYSYAIQNAGVLHHTNDLVQIYALNIHSALEDSAKTHVYCSFKFGTESITELIATFSQIL